MNDPIHDAWLASGRMIRLSGGLMDGRLVMTHTFSLEHLAPVLDPETWSARQMSYRALIDQKPGVPVYLFCGFKAGV